jgi:CDP-4-dehydro-6-deoxyglucose reductase
MAVVTYRNRAVELQVNESVLQGLERTGEEIPSSCRSGACQCCLMRAVEGEPPSKSQAGLKDTLKCQEYFLACQCIPDGDMTVALPTDDALPLYRAQVLEKFPVSRDIVSVRLSCPEGMQCRPGQYIQVLQDGHIRSYSIASLPEQDGWLELHVRRITGGKLSNWFHDVCQPGMQCSIRGPFGSCFYIPDEAQDFPVLLVGTSSGLAPLEGVARDALARGHKGPIVLIHGAREKGGLYHQQELAQLQSEHNGFRYRTSVADSGDAATADIRVHAKNELNSLGARNARIFLCGAPGLVNEMKVGLFLAGAASANIHSDPFVISKG